MRRLSAPLGGRRLTRLLAGAGSAATGRAHAVDVERVVGHLVTGVDRDLALALLDLGIHELIDPPAFEAEDMVVVRPGVELVDRMTALEAVPGHDLGVFELGQHPIDRGETYVLAGIEQGAVQLLGAHVSLGALFEDLQDLQTRQRDLQPGFTKILAHRSVPIVNAIGRRYDARPVMHAQTRIAVLATVLMLALGACSVYSPEVRQGNFVEDAKLAQVKPGMTRAQVRFLLGPPMIADAFHQNQWDYYFQVVLPAHLGGTELRSHFVVRFDGDFVASVEEIKPPAATKRWW